MSNKQDLHTGYKTVLGREISALLNPRPAVLVTCCDASGNPNILTVAWHSPLSHEPPLVGISVGINRYSHRLISETGEFVINLVDKNFTEALNICGKYTGELDNKATLADLSLYPSQYVKPQKIHGALGFLECRVEQRIPVGDHTFFVAQVLLAEAKESAFSDRWLPSSGDIILCSQRNKFGIMAK